MQILTLLGSPRKHGNTEAVLRRFEAKAVDAGHHVTRVDVAELEIAGCLGCDCCQSLLEDLDCAQSDDTEGVLRQIIAADLTVYAAPVYCWSVPAQMKALIDRHYCMVKWQGGEVAVALMRGKRAALLLTCGGEAATNVDLTFPLFERQMEYMQAEVAGLYALDNCIGVKEDAARAEELAARMAAELL
ncbi:MAG: flavodoxin family protein [Anaerolineae bacterium]|nr:flavodoxin family protein [Anaerolineae bacterium]